MRRMINQTTNQIATPITRTVSGGANIRASFSSTYDLRIAISTAPVFMHSSTSLRVKRSAKRSLPNAVSHCSLVVGTKTSIPLQLERQEVHPIHRTANASHNSSNPRPRRTAISAPLHRHRPGRSAGHAACANLRPVLLANRSSRFLAAASTRTVKVAERMISILCVRLVYKIAQKPTDAIRTKPRTNTKLRKCESG